MTKREFYQAVVEAAINDDLTAFATAEIAKTDARNAKRAATPSKKQKENEPLKAAILDLLAEGNKMSAGDLAVALNISTPKASALCTDLRKNGSVIATEEKVKGKGKHNVYSLAVTAEVEDEEEGE